MRESIKMGVLLLQGFTYGLFMEVIGPSLPDLQCVMGVDDGSVKLLLLLIGIGSITFCLTLPVFIKLFPVYMITVVCSFVVGLGFFVFPLTTSLFVVSVVVFLMAGFVELGIAVQYHIACVFWPNDGRVIQLISIAAGLGYVISPFVLSSFLSDGFITLWYKTLNTDQQVYKNGSMDQTNETSQTTETIYQFCKGDFTTLLIYPYYMFGCCCILCMLGALHLLFKGHTIKIVQGYEVFDERVLSKRLELVYRILTFLLHTSLIGITNTPLSILPTFGISPIFGLKRSTMSLMVSTNSLANLIGRVLPLFASSFVTNKTIVMISLILLTLAMISLAGTPLVGEVLLWIASITSGFLSGLGTASAIIFCVEIVPGNASLTSWYMISIAFGFVHPYICGILMVHFGAVVFVYYMPILCMVANVTTLGLHIFKRKHC